jgi:site-specific DNA-methyltransferase (adenine-specific)
MSVALYNGDCLEVLQSIPDGSVDMILCDLPYGTTACKWDTVIPFEPLWVQYKRVIKRNGAIVLFGSQPFTSALVMSNLGDYRYSWVWDKASISNPQLAKYQPLKAHEDIAVFSQVPHAYIPQGTLPYQRDRKQDSSQLGHCKRRAYTQTVTNYPKSIIPISVERGLHPTQKPVPLMEYLIRTYTNESEVVLDNTMGSGTTGVACVSTNRDFIGIELDKGFFDIAKRRIEQAQNTARQAELEVCEATA